MQQIIFPHSYNTKNKKGHRKKNITASNEKEWTGDNEVEKFNGDEATNHIIQIVLVILCTGQAEQERGLVTQNKFQGKTRENIKV